MGGNSTPVSAVLGRQYENPERAPGRNEVGKERMARMGSLHYPLTVRAIMALSTNRVELLKTRNQLHATRGRVESHRIVPVDSPLDSPASLLQLSASAAS